MSILPKRPYGPYPTHRATNSKKIFSKIVITGGAGFIGSHVVERFVKEYPGAEITVFDKMTYAADVHNIAHLLDWNGGNVKLMVGDLTNFELMKTITAGADLVLHLAAESHVDNSFGNSLNFTITNTVGTHTLLEACRVNQVPKIIHVSTDEVYGEAIGCTHTEDDKLNPTNPYSASKAAADMIVMGYLHSYKMPIVITRANNIFGIRQFPEKLIPKFTMLGLLDQKMTIHGPGTNTRCFLDARDFADAMILLSQRGEIGEIYNVGTDEEYQVLKVAEMISSILGIDHRIEHVNDRLFNDGRYSVLTDKIKGLGWIPTRSLKDQLPAVVRWYQLNSNRYVKLFN